MEMYANLLIRDLSNELCLSLCEYLPIKDLYSLRLALPGNDFPIKDMALYTLLSRKIKVLGQRFPELFTTLNTKPEFIKEVFGAFRVYLGVGERRGRKRMYNARKRYEAVKDNTEVTEILSGELLKSYSDREEKSKDLIDYAARGDIVAVRNKLNEEGVWINAQNEIGATAVYRVAGLGHVDILRLLLGKGADPNIPDWVHNMPILDAAQEAHEMAVELLLEAGANPNVSDKMLGRTPLWWAAGHGLQRTVKQLLAAGANLDEADDCGQTPIASAIQSRRVEVVRLLLEAGANPNGVDKMGRTLIWEARDMADIKQMLLTAGADLKGIKKTEALMKQLGM